MRASRTGKSQVPCPSCGTEYIIVAERMDDVIDCQECGRAFVPSKASRSGLRKGGANPAQPYLIGAGAVLLFLVVLVIAQSGGDDPGQQQQQPTAEKRVELGRANPRVAGVIAFAEAMQSGQRFQIARHTALDEMREFLGIENINGTRAEINDRVLDALIAHEAMPLLRDTYVASGRVKEADAEADRGKVLLELPFNPGKDKNWDMRSAQLMVDFVLDGDEAKAAGFAWVTEPQARAAADPSRTRPKVHEVLGQAEDVKRVYDGQEVVVREAEIKPLGHLEDTPDAVRQEIDSLIAQLIDLDAGGHIANRANLALKKIGKPAVPRLLNQMYEIPADSRENILRLRRIVQGLEDLTGQRMGFNPSVVGEVNVEQVREKRESALKQWYGWWADNHWRKDFDYAIEKGDEEAMLEEMGGEMPKKKIIR